MLSAILDVPRLRYLLIYDMLESVASAFQEVRQVGRRRDSTHITDLVDIVITSNDCCFLPRCDQYQSTHSKVSCDEKKKIVKDQLEIGWKCYDSFFCMMDV